MKSFFGVTACSIVLLATSCSSSNPPSASLSADVGSSAGNGSDNPPVGEGSSWFLGDQTISYCYQSAPDFGASQDLVESVLHQAFKTWSDYIVSRPVGFSTPNDVKFSFPTKSELKKYCDGSEDVRFYFGVKNDQVNLAKSHYDNPAAFSQRTAYDPTVGWGKGFVWVAPLKSVFPQEGYPDWSASNELLAIVLHEIGHIYGSGHVAGTIMDEKLNDQLRWDHSGDRLTQIDLRRFLLPCFHCSITVPGIFGWKDDQGTESPELTFEYFFARKPIGAITAHIETSQLSESASLIVQDAQGTTNVPISITKPSTSTPYLEQGVPVFQGYRKDSSKTVIGSQQSAAYVLYGTARTTAGDPVLLSIEINSLTPASWGVPRPVTWGGPISIKYFRDQRIFTLFLGQLP